MPKRNCPSETTDVPKRRKCWRDRSPSKDPSVAPSGISSSNIAMDGSTSSSSSSSAASASFHASDSSQNPNPPNSQSIPNQFHGVELEPAILAALPTSSSSSQHSTIPGAQEAPDSVAGGGDRSNHSDPILISPNAASRFFASHRGSPLPPSLISRSTVPRGRQAPIRAGPPSAGQSNSSGLAPQPARSTTRLFAEIHVPQPPPGTSPDQNQNVEDESTFGTVLRAQVRLRTERATAGQARPRATSSVSFPLWVLCSFLFLFGFLAALYPHIISNFDGRLVREMKAVTEQNIQVAYWDLNAASSLENPNARFFTIHPFAQWLMQKLVRLHVNCISRLPEVLAFGLCPPPHPGGFMFQILINPFEAWVLSNSLLKSPRLTILFLLVSPKYQTGNLIESSSFWTKWLLCPFLAIAELIRPAAVYLSPIACFFFMLWAFRAQVDEYRRVFFGPSDWHIFRALDSFIMPIVFTLVGLILPNLFLVVALFAIWIWRLKYTFRPFEPISADPSPISRHILHQIVSYLFSVYSREVPRARVADYPFNHQEEPTTNEEVQCAICCNNKKNTVLVPCCHTMCRACADRLPNTHCPFCHARYRFLQFVRI